MGLGAPGARERAGQPAEVAEKDAEAAAKQATAEISEALEGPAREWLPKWLEFWRVYGASAPAKSVVKKYLERRDKQRGDGARLFEEARALFQQEKKDEAYAKLEKLLQGGALHLRGLLRGELARGAQVTMEPALPSSEVLAQHGGFVRALAQRLLRDQHDADDLAQDAWVRYFEAPPRGALDPRGWFATVVANLARSSHRARDRRATREGSRGAQRGAAQRR